MFIVQFLSQRSRELGTGGPVSITCRCQRRPRTRVRSTQMVLARKPQDATLDVRTPATRTIPPSGAGLDPAALSEPASLLVVRLSLAQAIGRDAWSPGFFGCC